MPATFVVHYAEIALKGKNRPDFVRALRHNLTRALSQVGDLDISSREGRFIIKVNGDAEIAKSRLSTVFGVAWYAEAIPVSGDYDSIKDSVLHLAQAAGGSTFMIDARRTDKSTPLSSLELARKLGAEVVAQTGWKVKLRDPDSRIHVDVLKDGALVYSNKTKGLGGLPVGTAGRVMHLFSGGIDSPVAAWLMMKRGCTPVYLHFYLAPTPQYALQSKITRLVKVLSQFSGKSTLLLIPFAEYQLATAGIPGDLEPSLFRRFMRMTAEALASDFDTAAISTGDCLSQAASQTLWNIGTFDEGSSLPVLRPLLTYDKDEVIQMGRNIGTYDLSIEKYKDCCAIITRHPKTRAKKDVISEYSKRLSFAELVRKSIEAGTLAAYDTDSGEWKVLALNSLNQPRGVRVVTSVTLS